MAVVQHLGSKDAPHTGTNADEKIVGGSGDDVIHGGGGKDTLLGGEGNDTLYSGMRWLNGAWVDDYVGDYLDGGPGDDTVIGGSGADELYGGDGDDSLYTAQLKVDGTFVNDTTGDLLDGGAGNDELLGSDGADTLLGGSGNDKATGNLGNDRIDGGSGNDNISGGSGDDILAGGDDDDLVWGDSGGDQLSGGNGDDELYGGDDADSVQGGAGDDFIEGGAGDDKLQGDAGNDYLGGGDGNDTLDGGSGINLMLGGEGDDQYIVRQRTDLIVDAKGRNSGLIMADWFKEQGTVSWSWAEGVQKLPYWIDALTFEHAGGLRSYLDGQDTVYYRFAEQVESWFSETDKAGFSAFTPFQKDAMRQALDYISSVTKLRFVLTTETDLPYSIVFGNNRQQDSGGYAIPINGAGPSVLMLAHGSADMPPGLVLHELGHSLQLKHPFAHADSVGGTAPGPYLPTAEDHTELSVMSYTDGPHGGLGLNLAPFDLAALHWAYGVAPGARAGDDTYVLDDKAMHMLWDGNGRDTVDGSALAKDLTLDLRPGYWSFIDHKESLISAAGQITVNFGTMLEVALGGAGNDKLTGNEAANTLDGGAGNDVLAGREGNDVLQGGAGSDTAVYSGKRADYTITRSGSEATVSDGKGSEGKDSLLGVERLKFADSMVALDTDGTVAQVYRLYQAAFDRKPDLAGLGYWIGVADKGVSLKEIASAFTHGAEFDKLFGAKADDATFLARVYANVLHRQYDQPGFDFWLGALKNGVAREDLLIDFAASKENVAAVATLIANGIEYTPFG